MDNRVVGHNSALVLEIKDHIYSDSVSGSLSGRFVYNYTPSSVVNMMNLLDGLELLTHPSEVSPALFATVSREIQIYVYTYFLFTTHHNFYISTGNCTDFPT